MRFVARSSAYMKAPQRVVFSVLAGYRKYDAWVPDVTRSRFFAREGELAIAEFIAPPYGQQKLVLEFIESPHDSLVFNQVDRFRKDGLSGSFRLTPADDGAGVVVTGELGFRGGPRHLGCRRRLAQVLERTLAALSDRALKVLNSGLSDVPGQHAKILELEIGGDRATLRVGGESYDLVRRTEEPA